MYIYKNYMYIRTIYIYTPLKMVLELISVRGWNKMKEKPTSELYLLSEEGCYVATGGPDTLGGKVEIVLTSSHPIFSLFRLTCDLHSSYSWCFGINRQCVCVPPHLSHRHPGVWMRWDHGSVYVLVFMLVLPGLWAPEVASCTDLLL